jgi:phenylacetate-coenzyme A ligase PaaK-like adenylate-forming protein
VYPSQIEDVIAGTPGTSKDAWQIYVDTVEGSPDAVTVAVECETGRDGERTQLAATVARELQSRLGLKVPVECHAQGTLPRYETKAKRILLKEKP